MTATVSRSAPHPAAPATAKRPPARELRVDDISYAYDGALAVDGVSLRVSGGEIVALLGSNGAGKTTIAKLIAGALRPRQGSIHFGDIALAGLASHQVVRHSIVLVPEGRLVFAQMTIHENLLLGAHKERRRDRVAELLERNYTLFPRLRERRGQLAGSLSGGEQQMLAIARGLMGEPRLLVLDEPSLGIMPKLVGDIFTLIRQIAAQGVSVLLIEQNARASLEIADRAYVLEKGRIILEGNGRDLLRDDFVSKAYLGVSGD
ncbi:ABC transporter ATP-binding protein [Bordetella sp. BOR01]|uniref:ABC transporter ATP-binding protein n=1 Tax=Bordetella sp. BOR01 TaxID=2854779 RepID=UPI001C482EA0|nr:ABC transporter ATP-binding protein [Bordetella sp. BOR01]MBV7483830.1 ABC transporter ATP-binding protein [Bordetella sp. BOR01]